MTSPITSPQLAMPPAKGTRTAQEESGVWLFRALILIVAIAPLPLGSNRPLPLALLSLAVALLLCLWALGILRGGKKPTVPPARLRWALLFYGLTCTWIFIQWLPLGVGDPMWKIAAQVTGQPVIARLTVNPDETLAGLLRLMTYGGVFWLSLQLSTAPKRASSGIKALAIIGGLYATYGLVIFVLGNHWILIYPKWAYQGSLTSTFVNRNSYATFDGMCLLAISALLLEHIRDTLSLRWPLRLRIVRITEQLLMEYGWLTASFLLTFIALFLTGSRAGIASTVCGLLLLSLFFLRRRSLRTGSIATILIGTILLGAIAYGIGSSTLEKRYEAPAVIAYSTTLRQNDWSLALTAIRSAPLTGTGFGSFPDVITAYRTGATSPMSQIDKAHNTYLENTVELGIPANFCLNFALVLLTWHCLNGFFARRRNWHIPALGVSVTLLVGLHSFVDFSLQIPAIAMTYAFVMGLAVGQSWRQ